MASFDETMQKLQEMIDLRNRSERNMTLVQKKMEVALLEGNDAEIEKARVDIIAAFEASIDVAIKAHREVRLLEKK